MKKDEEMIEIWRPTFWCWGSYLHVWGVSKQCANSSNPIHETNYSWIVAYQINGVAQTSTEMSVHEWDHRYNLQIMQDRATLSVMSFHFALPYSWIEQLFMNSSIHEYDYSWIAISRIIKKRLRAQKSWSSENYSWIFAILE